ncbi:MAG TPA: hypothetical protein V6D29_23180 [Leptolyngbyaceae cyanobacterium]
MTSREFRFSLKAITKRVTVLLMSVVLLFGFSQTAALANSTSLGTESTSTVLIALAASSRFAAQSELKGQESPISAARLDELREKRREWQSEVSSAANTENEDESGSVVDKVVKDKLNLNEITEENEIVEEIKKH